MLIGEESVWLERLKETAEIDSARAKAFQRWKNVKDLFGSKLRVARAVKNYSMRDVARELNISAQAISKYETGKMMPRTETLVRLSELYGVSIGWLLCDCPIILSCTRNCSESEAGGEQS